MALLPAMLCLPCGQCKESILSRVLIMVRFSTFSDNLSGMEHLWFVGDNFMAKSYRTHFKRNTSSQRFIKDNFEPTPFVNSRFSSSNTNMLSRIQNTFAAALNQMKKMNLPRYVVIVLDDDLITFLNFKDEGAATLLGTWVKW